MKLSALSTTKVGTTGNGGQRDVSLNLSRYLESGEVISTMTVSVSDSDLITISNGTISSQSYNFHVTAAPTNFTGSAYIYLEMEGDAGSYDTFKIEQPLQRYITK